LNVGVGNGLFEELAIRARNERLSLDPETPIKSLVSMHSSRKQARVGCLASLLQADAI